ncbi:type II secretion system F family protein [Paenibacillus sp. UNC451MF]|uniref:type II secretion system F family protein n=1 Tax=Paenibacillus sp. UNC451MF TaxID=1449063 RepID=UPI00048E9466|nr:type II secretion system F family protein [Paenibacillus sp. UNC451MF]
MAMLIVLGIEFTLCVLISWTAYSQYISFVKEHRKQIKIIWLAPLALYLMDRLHLADRLAEAVSRVHQQMIGLHGSKNALMRTKCFIADILSLSVVILIGCTLIGVMAEGNSEMLGYGVVLILFVPFVLYKELSNQLRKKKRLMLLELPEVLNQIVLLVNAGETVQKALQRCIESKTSIEKSPLLSELAIASYEISMNASFTKAMEDFNKRCGVQEVSLFTTTLLLNYKRGGDELVMSLKELSSTLWEKRKSLAKTLGEEASSKMVFPMVLIFFIVMVVVAAPAILLMN